MNQKINQTVRLDLKKPVFQRQLFRLSKIEQRNILNTLRKLANMTWQQVYTDHGLKSGRLYYPRKALAVTSFTVSELVKDFGE
jgi:hypothetical protein